MQQVISYSVPVVQYNLMLDNIEMAEETLHAAKPMLQPPMDQFLSFSEAAILARKGEFEAAHAALDGGDRRKREFDPLALRAGQEARCPYAEHAHASKIDGTVHGGARAADVGRYLVFPEEVQNVYQDEPAVPGLGNVARELFRVGDELRVEGQTLFHVGSEFLYQPGIAPELVVDPGLHVREHEIRHDIDGERSYDKHQDNEGDKYLVLNLVEPRQICLGKSFHRSF